MYLQVWEKWWPAPCSVLLNADDRERQGRRRAPTASTIECRPIAYPHKTLPQFTLTTSPVIPLAR